MFVKEKRAEGLDFHRDSLGVIFKLSAFNGNYADGKEREESTLFPLAAGAVVVNCNDPALGFHRIDGGTSNALGFGQAKMAVLGCQCPVNLLEGNGKGAFVLFQSIQDAFQCVFCVIHGVCICEMVEN